MHNDDNGPQLGSDLQQLRRLHRRAVLRGVFGLGLVGVASRIAACVASASDLGLENADGTCNEIPGETAGPYPGDGSNGKNALTLDGIVRSDIRSTLGGSAAPGVPLTLTLKLVDGSCQPLAGKAVYLWHCDRDGKYSMYDLPSENWLRGVQESDDDGVVTFTSIFPGCYSGRWPHIHFEIYPSLAQASSSSTLLATSQLALPQDACDAVYTEADGYDRSVDNLANNDLASDNVFSDGTGRQLATVGGSLAAGMTAALTVAVDV